jgi:molybdenum cofactor synthesis domain-containing protein
VTEERVWTAALLVIGDEILSGRTQDKNIAQVALWLNGQGIRLQEVRVVADVEEAIVAAVNALRTAYDYVITTGGIGPTHDDITVDSIAAAFGVSVTVHPQAREILQHYYEQRGLELTDARLRMARVPEGAELIPNPTSGAPGVKMENVYILAGVPNIAAAMLEALDGKLVGGKPVVSVTVSAHAAESEVAALLQAVQDEYPGASVGSYPFYREGGFGADFVVRSEDGELAKRCAQELRSRLIEAGVELVDGR